MNASPEDRRLKALGLLLGAVAVAWMLPLAAMAERVWLFSSAHELGTLVWRTTLGGNLLALAIALLARGCGLGSHWPLPRWRRATLLWLGMTNAAVPLSLYALLDDQGRLERRLDGTGWDLLLGAVLIVLALLIWRMWRRSRRQLAPSAAGVMVADPRPPLLYLRSFADDDNAVIDDGGFSEFERVVGWLGPPSPEEEMARILQHAGPVVAIGQPGEELPRLGAARLYVSDDAWQGAVLALMRQAQLVVIRVGASPGVRWEIEQAFQHVPLRRIVLVFHGRDAGRIHPEVQQRLAGVLSGDWAALLPTPAPRGMRAWWARPDLKRRIGSLVCFPDGGTPHLVCLSHWPPWGRDAWPLFALRASAPPLLRGWRVVFERLGIDGGAYSAPKSRGLAILLAVFFGGFGAHWFYLRRRRCGWIYCGLFFLGSFMAGFWDALRFVWMDRARFEGLMGAEPSRGEGGH